MRAIARMLGLLLLLTSAVPMVSAASLSPDLLSALSQKQRLDEPVDVIVQLTQALGERDYEYLMTSATNVRRFGSLPMMALTLPMRDLPRWAAHPKIRAISLDQKVEAHTAPADSQLELTTGRAALFSNLETYWVDGYLANVAVLDSGVSKDAGVYLSTSTSTSSSPGDVDGYGHGTHIAGIIRGNTVTAARYAGLNFDGLAAGANLISVKVLDAWGKGSMSDVLAGIDWVLTNGAANSIRVVNLSLGAPAVESYRTDPLCQATKLLYQAGFVVVASAGNIGNGPDGKPLYGTITSPGDSPWVITVGAVDDRGTQQRSDDQLASFSSRGPTRSRDASNGVYDHQLKPDLLAPGVNIVAPTGIGTTTLRTALPTRVVWSGTSKNLAYMRLSGTSMAAAAVSGAASMMLEANPELTPAQVKALLMYTAQTLPGQSVFDQGAGELNIEGAVRFALELYDDGRYAMNAAPVAGVILPPSSMPAPYSTIAGETFPWAKGTILVQQTGQTGLTQAGGILFAEGILFADGVVRVNGILFAEGIVFAEGILFAETSSLNAQGIVFAEGSLPLTPQGYLNASGLVFAESASLGYGSLCNAAGLIFAEGILFAEGIVFTEMNGPDPQGVDFVGQCELEKSLALAGPIVSGSDLLKVMSQSNTAFANINQVP